MFLQLVLWCLWTPEHDEKGSWFLVFLFNCNCCSFSSKTMWNYKGSKECKQRNKLKKKKKIRPSPWTTQPPVPKDHLWFKQIQQVKVTIYSCGAAVMFLSMFFFLHDKKAIKRRGKFGWNKMKLAAQTQTGCLSFIISGSVFCLAFHK